MTTFLLIHGSFQGGWIWQPTVEQLRADGHQVYAPTLDGCGERRVHLRPGITVSSVARELAELAFYEDMQDLVLVGTSSGGLVVQILATLIRARVDRLVFLDALVPASGESVADIVHHAGGPPPYAITELTRGLSRDAFGAGLFAELAGEQKEWALDRVTAHPLGLSDHQPGDVDAFWSSEWRCTVIRCAESPNPPEAHQRRTAETLQATWREMPAGHYPMLTHPALTASLLLD
ncbi:MAG: alpha/beta hydrolase [Pseudomonadota bacterium]